MNSRLCLSSHQPSSKLLERVAPAPPPPPPRVHLIKTMSYPQGTGEFISTLPERKGWAEPLIQYKDFWFRRLPLEQILLLQDAMEPRADDIILATQPKCGTTWLKALAFAVTNRSRYSFTDDHPLLTTHPHRAVPYIEIPSPGTDHAHRHLEALPSPRLLATHMPMSLLPLHAGSRVVYLCRDPKDTLVSKFYFERRISETSDLSMDSAFSMFCDGFSSSGPFWDHCLEYWKESLARPNNVLFLRYEEIKSDPVQVVRKLAAFLGVPLTQEEESSGAAQEVVSLCSFEKLTSLQINQVGGVDRGNRLYVGNSMFYRKGEVGDWMNHMSHEMGEKLDRIVREKLQGSGLVF
uniref:Uncharacterized protein n=1 Tax=Avena sativa TaxID=4498 RepID=A0ACD5ZM03_AVESA